MILMPLAIVLFPIWIGHLWWFLISWIPAMLCLLLGAIINSPPYEDVYKEMDDEFEDLQTLLKNKKK